MIYLCDIPPPQRPRWIPGDQHVRKHVRRLLEPFRGKPPGGLRKVTQNLVKGLCRLGIAHKLCTDVEQVPEGELVGILNGPKSICRELASRNPCVTGPGILNGSSEWLDLFENSQAIFHLQNCEWAAALYAPVYGDHLRIWTMGIDEQKYIPSNKDTQFDFLIYDKIRWPETSEYQGLLSHCESILRAQGLSYHYIRYGRYPGGKESSYHSMLAKSRAMLYLSENETQGFAYNEAMSMGVPILAWDIGKWCDPMRFELGMDGARASSVPYFDERCGMTFQGKQDFPTVLQEFVDQRKAGNFSPREYVLQNLRLEDAAERYVAILDEARLQC